MSFIAWEPAKSVQNSLVLLKEKSSNETRALHWLSYKKKKKKIHLPLKEILAMEVAKPLAVKPADLDSGLLLSQ